MDTKDTRPNILLYFTDQQRADTCGCFNEDISITPNLDALALEGVAFDNAFTPQPVCGPFRAMLQTGRWATELGCFRNNIRLPDGVKTLANYITEAGYETGYAGKWHLASDGDPECKSQNLDFFYAPVPKEYRGGYDGFWRASDVLEFTSDGYSGYVFDENNKKISFSGYRTDCITDMALDFFEGRDKTKPFFLTISHIEPHHQNNHRHYEGPVGSKERFKDCVIPGDLLALPGDYREEYPDYLGACASLDENLGKVINKLKEEGVYENTVIIFLSDHGSHFKTRNQDSNKCGADDYKRSCHDASLRVPLVIAGGPYRGGKHIKNMISTASIPKTVLALAGIDVGNEMIGENLFYVLEGKVPKRAERIFAQISESRVARCIRTPDWLYSIHAPGIEGSSKAGADYYEDDFLYDLKNDPLELNNLVGNSEYDTIRDGLRKELLDWIEETEGIRPRMPSMSE